MKTTQRKEIGINLKKEFRAAIKEVLTSLKNFDNTHFGKIRFESNGEVIGLISNVKNDKKDNLELVVYNLNKPYKIENIIFGLFIDKNDTISSAMKELISKHESDIESFVNGHIKSILEEEKRISISNLERDLQILSSKYHSALANNSSEKYKLQVEIFDKFEQINTTKQQTLDFFF